MRKLILAVWQNSVIWMLFFVLCLLVTLYFSVIAVPSLDPVGLEHGDKLLHGLAFFALTFCLSRSAPKWPWMYIYGVVLTIGLFIELFQWGNPPRTASVTDFLADVAGVWLGFNAVILISHWIYRVQPGTLAIED